MQMSHELPPLLPLRTTPGAQPSQPSQPSQKPRNRKGKQKKNRKSLEKEKKFQVNDIPGRVCSLFFVFFPENKKCQSQFFCMIFFFL